MTDKVQKIREEVERLKEETSIGLSEHENGVEQGRMEIINALSLFLDSLQKEPVSEELEEAANAYAITVYNNYLDNPKAFENIDADTLNEDAFKAGAKWQKQQFEKDYTDLCNGIVSAKGLAVKMAYDKGMADAREQMMVKAIDVEVKVDAGGYPYTPAIELYDYDKDVPLAKEGDKYKVILIKED